MSENDIKQIHDAQKLASLMKAVEVLIKSEKEPFENFLENYKKLKSKFHQLNNKK